jgi:hypothetical protein
VEFIRNQLTTDLIHAVQIKGGVRIHEGRHEVPLDKDNSRPQFVIEPPKGGCRVSATFIVGSDRLSSEEDLDVTRPTTSRSRPMVKKAGVVLDPPLPLANVAPTLIHFPTLFEDRVVPTLRRIQIVRIVLDLVSSFSSFLEKVLWIIESKCQIHLSKVQINPIYKGQGRADDDAPEWRLSLSFSGHALLFGWIPVPFIGVTLPTFIIPQPHALLEFLLTPEPLASAKLRRENIAEKQIAIAVLNSLEGWNVEAKAVATPPALGVDVTLPGGVALAIELMPGRDPGAGMRRQEGDMRSFHPSNNDLTDPVVDQTSVGNNSLSSWTTRPENQSGSRMRYSNSKRTPTAAAAAAANAFSQQPAFDANKLVPWMFHFVAKGAVGRDRMSVNITKCSLTHEHDDLVSSKSSFSTAGSFAVWKADLATALSSNTIPAGRRASYGHLVALQSSEETPSLGEILLYPEENSSMSTPSKILRLLEYDYAFDVFETQIDAVTCCVGASHPMLRGGTMITTIM